MSDPNFWFQFGRKQKPKHPICLAILTSWDIKRLKRAIQSLKRQKPAIPFWVEINSTSDEYITQAVSLCEKTKADCHISLSTGQAGVGKQAVFDEFLSRFDQPFCYILDGDDWLYPSASTSLLKTVNQYSSLDVLTYIPLDVIQSKSGWFPIAPQAYANFWDKKISTPHNWDYGPGYAEWLWGDNLQITGPGRTVLFSRKATEKLEWNPTIKCYEDTLLLLNSLALHQKGELFSACSMAQDTFIFDRTSPESGQKKNDLVRASQELRHEAQLILKKERSSVGELPLLFQESYISYEDKIKYAKKTYP